MFCHRCGAQVDSNAQFCTSCGQPMAAPGALAGASAVPWIPPANVKAQTGRWIGAAWTVVKADLGNFVLIGIAFSLLGYVPFIQVALIEGMEIYCMKKLLGRPAEF